MIALPGIQAEEHLRQLEISPPLSPIAPETIFELIFASTGDMQQARAAEQRQRATIAAMQQQNQG